MLLNGAKDDWHAIYETAVSQYQFWPRLFGVVILSYILIVILRRILITRTWLPEIIRVLLLFLQFCFCRSFWSSLGLVAAIVMLIQYTGKMRRK